MGSSINLADIERISLLSHEHAQFHRVTVTDLLKRQTVKFPGAQPISFARRHLQELQRKDYFLVEKTDGVRCLLFSHEIHDEETGATKEVHMLIDRKNDYYMIEPGYLHLPRAVFDKNGRPAQPPYDVQSYHILTLLDGELVRQRFPDGHEQLTYLMFDCLALDGENITLKDYGSRIGRIDRFIYEPWRAFAKDWPQETRVQPFQIAWKKPHMPYATPDMFSNIIPNLPHGNDGLIFTCKETPYVSGTDVHILKWKPPHENTVDFRLQLGAFPTEVDEDGTHYEDFDQKPHIDLLVYHGNDKPSYRTFAPLHLTDTEWAAMKSMQQQLDWRIIECYREADTGRWRPKIETDGTPRFRDDKEHANHVSVVDSVIESIEDAVTEHDLIGAFPKIKAAWKEREKLGADRRRAAEQELRKRHEAAKQAQQQQTQRKASAEEDDGPAYTE
ncbi:mRNA-capping enzyme subunit alpha like protein [Zymoseptoria brevis]|uniref:mRNA-capping enzyme subunit alpha n=1 Tax=Zymoseptoria brevis TaxID=1047168 RepID=A0A0F4GY56_9PEZI|nr:mRNA-capping enzyme subunit alpha like protein [Zymoseptoria brevis]